MEDIIAMKLSAIADNGSRLKDFIDIAFLSTRFPFNTMLRMYERKFPQSNVIRPFKAITYFDDIDFEENIIMLNGEYDWKLIERRLIDMTKIQNKIFESFPLLKRNRKRVQPFQSRKYKKVIHSLSNKGVPKPRFGMMDLIWRSSRTGARSGLRRYRSLFRKESFGCIQEADEFDRLASFFRLYFHHAVDHPEEGFAVALTVHLALVTTKQRF